VLVIRENVFGKLTFTTRILNEGLMNARETAFMELMDNYLGVYRSVAYKIVGDPSDTDDCIQDALLKAWNKLDSFKGDCKLATWVYKITVNVCHDFLRKRCSEENKVSKMANDPSIAVEHAAGNGVGDRLDLLEKAIAELPEIYRDAINVGVLSGLGGEEAADLLDFSRNTLRQRIFKAKELLRIKMEDSNGKQ